MDPTSADRLRPGVEDVDVARHQSALATWVVRRIGNAMLVGVMVGVGALVVLFLVGDGDPDAGTAWAAVACGFVACAAYLSTASAPPPPST